MNIEKQIEDLCLERLRLEREDTTQEPADNIQQQAKAQARYQIRRAKIQAIDSQLEELRNKLATQFNGSAKDINKQIELLSFLMHDEWCPDSVVLVTCDALGLDEIPLVDFRTYWRDRGVMRTHSHWQLTLLKEVIRRKT